MVGLYLPKSSKNNSGIPSYNRLADSAVINGNNPFEPWSERIRERYRMNEWMIWLPCDQKLVHTRQLKKITRKTKTKRWACCLPHYYDSGVSKPFVDEIRLWHVRRRLHIAIGMQTRLQTGLQTQPSKHYLRIWPRPLASFVTQCLRRRIADGRGRRQEGWLPPTKRASAAKIN